MNILINLFILAVLIITGWHWALPFAVKGEWFAVGLIAFFVFGFGSLFLGSKK